MTDVSNLDELANAIASSSAKIKAYAKAQAAATQSQEAEIRSLDTRLDALEAPVPPPPPPPPTGTVIFDGGFDTGNESQWSYIHRYTTDRFRVTASADGVSPRGGSHMARIECRSGEPASWTAGRNATLAEKNGLQNVGLGSTTYTGFSVYLPDSYVPTNVGGDLYGNVIAEWHSEQSGAQAPFHFGVNGQTGQYFIDLHITIPWGPVFIVDVGPIIKGQWVDFVAQHKWSTGTDGIVKFWKNGALVHSYTGRTWGTQTTNYPTLGLYRHNAPFTNVLYVDAFRVGTTYTVVDPSSY